MRLPQAVELLLVLALEVEQVVESRVVDLGPTDHFLPVDAAAAMGIGRVGINVVNVFQFLLRGQRLLHQVGVEAAEAEDDPVEEPIPPPSPPPQQLVVSVKKEETETRIIDDADQRELAKSMTAFFGTLVEEAKVDKEGN